MNITLLPNILENLYNGIDFIYTLHVNYIIVVITNNFEVLTYFYAHGPGLDMNSLQLKVCCGAISCCCCTTGELTLKVAFVGIN